MKQLHHASFSVLGSLLLLVGCGGHGGGSGGSLDDPWDQGGPGPGGERDYAGASSIAGSPSLAGSSATGGSPSDAGSSATGGSLSFAGSSATGGSLSLAGSSATGGSPSDAGSPATGGSPSCHAGSSSYAGGGPVGNACESTACDVPCAYIVADPNGGPIGPLYFDGNCSCTSLTPICPDGGAAGSSATGGAPSYGGAAGSSATAGGPSGGPVGGGVCAAMSCGAVCGYYSQYPGGPTQPMMCDAGEHCTPSVPYCGY